MENPLNAIEARILGCLLEKEVTTPEYYPLTLNSLLAACNQKSNREPVMELEEKDVFRGVETLREKHLVVRVDMAGSRVPKFRHALDKLVECSAAERALLCLLLLRGPQTTGELRSRSERLHPFPLLENVQSTLADMATEFDFPLVQALPLQPGRKEIRYAHLLSGDPEIPLAAPAGAPVSSLALELEAEKKEKAALQEQMNDLQNRLDDLQSRLDKVEEDWTAFRAQFD